jgi:nucleoside phosphorylase
VIDYRSERAGTSPDGSLERTSRAEPGDADDFLVQAFAALGERRPEPTERGPLLSDHVLVDNRHFRDKLVRLYPKAIGGEMEGYGIYTAARGRHRPWVLVKAVCDWGDGNKGVDKEERQRQAAIASSERLFDYLDC